MAARSKKQGHMKEKGAAQRFAEKKPAIDAVGRKFFGDEKWDRHIQNLERRREKLEKRGRDGE
jgi:hypothetical protein